MLSIKDVETAQAAWAEAVVALGQLLEDRAACLTAAEEALDRLYSFDSTDVLFKPTKAAVKPFRPDRKGALSYFIGGDADYPEDGGFALNPWTAVRFENAITHLTEDKACAMGHYYFTDTSGAELKVEYTFGYLLNDQKELRIFLHHSSLPFAPSS